MFARMPYYVGRSQKSADVELDRMSGNEWARRLDHYDHAALRDVGISFYLQHRGRTTWLQQPGANLKHATELHWPAVAE